MGQPAPLIDTDVLIDHFRGVRRLRAADGSAISVITRCELFAGRRADEEAINGVLAALTEHPVDQAVAERAGRLRRAHGLRTPDALIAATALEHGHPLVTRNQRDFRRVPGLTVRAPSAPEVT